MKVSSVKKLFFGKIRIFIKCPSCAHIIVLDDKLNKIDGEVNCFKCNSKYSIVATAGTELKLMGKK